MTTPAPTRRDLTSGHLWQIDLVRALAFSAVIAVHSIAFTQQPANQVAAGVLMILQFGREVFFALTGFVLVHSMAGGTRRAGAFWRRRLGAVVVPYLTWTGIYALYAVVGPAHQPWRWSVLWSDIITGNAAYHLYFLLVTMQLYVAFPLVWRFVRRTADRAWVVLGVVGALNLAWLAAVQYVAAPSGPAHVLWQRAYELLPSYSMYVLAGCYAAVHLTEVQGFVTRHARCLTGVALGCLGAALAAYAAQLGGRAPRDAAAVLQPAMLLTSVGAGLLLYLVASRWAAGPRRHLGLVRAASDVSFGVYLGHPLILMILTDHGLGNAGQVLPSPLATAVGIIVPAGGAAALAWAARRTPLAALLTGRPRVTARPARSAGFTPVVASARPAPATATGARGGVLVAPSAAA